jgi:glycosyltransferase involved in cell wall biosynthesis
LYVFKRLVFSFFKVKFDIDRPIILAKDFASQIKRRIRNISYDAILTSEPYLVTYLDSKKPIFIYTDFTFSTYYNHYFLDKKIHKQTLKDGNHCERRSLLKSKKIILTSKFAINDAIQKYKIKLNKFRYLPFGANINLIPKTNFLNKKILKKNYNICKLISIGVHWDRKGMDKAVKLVDYLNAQGQKAMLYVIGAKSPKGLKLSKNVTLVSFLDKNNLDDQKILANLLYKAHFNLLFSKAEAFGVVNVEASAFGLYTITNNIGGIGGGITNNINGYMFKEEEKLSVISNHILKIFRNKKLFVKKSFLSKQQYETKLNWNIISNNLYKIITNEL